ncbi:type II toxin-antitoxin system RelE family toxin [Labedaea rhizosphaerae]|uniref:mRNA interferase RelE/StbE n=1 Tax=Labedaea rhizosphaerae TaxID=598644 RepID=A0A4R6SRC0_LABRH|nr:type II toxin-antitoxin system RelE/ParE family toxin [Labedaea rhizosphaerae]TDQ05833.1 mRNA interferase RelE/StbE [Labedaea rhizosphaerae]
MSYEIELTSSADKFLGKLNKSQPKDAEIIEDTIEDLGAEPRPPGCRQLTGYPGVWRVRVGNYRICYSVDDGRLIVLVITISTRDDVYEVLKRKMRR